MLILIIVIINTYWDKTSGFTVLVKRVTIVNREEFTSVSKVIHLCFVFAFLSHRQPIRSKTKSNRDSLAHVFRPFAPAICMPECFFCDWPE